MHHSLAEIKKKALNFAPLLALFYLSLKYVGYMSLVELGFSKACQPSLLKELKLL